MPVLAYPQLDQPFILKPDKSNFGLGAVLTLRDESDNERVISYAIRALSGREKAFSATEKEALVVGFAIDQFRVYLPGVQFLLQIIMLCNGSIPKSLKPSLHWQTLPNFCLQTPSLPNFG